MSHYSTPESIDTAIGEVSRALAAADQITIAAWYHLLRELYALREKVERYEYVQTCQQAGAVCHDCGRLYGNEYGFPDLVVPDTIWKQISPTGDQYGLLCPSCMAGRCAKLGIQGAEARWTSGPFRGGQR